VFLGDSGSVPLASSPERFGAGGSARGVARVVPILVFSPFIVDASVTVLRRLMAGERIWRAIARIATSAGAGRMGARAGSRSPLSR
jgi:phospho-N-acetylmuramoyl-pentapeptide-transferase